MQRGQVVHHPEGASLGGYDQVVLLHCQVGDRHHRQVALEGVPTPAIVEGDIHPALSAGIEQAGAAGIGPDHPGKMSSRNPIDDLFPGLAVIAGLVEIRAEVIRFVTGSGHIQTARLGRMGFQAVDLGPFRQQFFRRGDVRPGLTAVAGEVDQPVVGTAPDYPGFMGALQCREDGAVIFYAGIVLGDRSAG